MGLMGLKLGDGFPFTRQFGAKRALIVLTSINLLNFADRYVPSAVKQLIIDDLHISDFQSSLPATGMVVVYMIFAVIFGTLSDKEIVDRRYILMGAVAFWSVATSLAGLAQNLVQLILLRSLVGVGEAAYGTIAPPMLSDFYPSWDRNVVFGLYYLAIPLGGALGYAIGAVLGSAFSWRVAFIACGIPGLVVSYMVLGLNDPVRGINDKSEEERKAEDSHGALTHGNEVKMTSYSNPSGESSFDKSTRGSTSGWRADLDVAYAEFKEIMTNWHFVFALGGLTANNFALGGLAEWAATFFLRYDDASIDSAGLIVGAATIIGGIGGNIIGAKVADYYQAKNVKSAYFLIPALFTIPAGILFLFAINITHNFPLVSVLLVLGEICVWTYLAPISALSITVIPPRLRSRSCGLQIFFQHILGDIISPPIIGAISDSTGSLQTGLQITWIAVLVSGLFWFLGYFLLKPLPTTHDNHPAPSSSASTSSQASLMDNASTLSQELVQDMGNSDLGDYNAYHRPSAQAANAADKASAGPHEDTTYFELLCGDDPLVLVDGVVVARNNDTDSHSKQSDLRPSNNVTYNNIHDSNQTHHQQHKHHHNRHHSDDKTGKKHGLAKHEASHA